MIGKFILYFVESEIFVIKKKNVSRFPGLGYGHGYCLSLTWGVSLISVGSRCFHLWLDIEVGSLWGFFHLWFCGLFQTGLVFSLISLLDSVCQQICYIIFSVVRSGFGIDHLVLFLLNQEPSEEILNLISTLRMSWTQLAKNWAIFSQFILSEYAHF